IGEELPAFPIVLGHAVFERNDRILLYPFRPELHHLLGGPLALVRLLEYVLAAFAVVELAGGGIDRNTDLRSRLVTGLGDGFQNRLYCFFVGLQVRRKTTLI